MTRQDGPGQLLLKPQDAARLLAVSERTLWQLTKDGVIPCVRLGTCKRYDPDDLKRRVQQLKTCQSI